MSHGGGGGGQKSAKKVSRIIWMAPQCMQHGEGRAVTAMDAVTAKRKKMLKYGEIQGKINNREGWGAMDI